MSAIWLMIREALTSKKFIMAIAGFISAAVLKLGFDLPVETVAMIITPIIVYIFSQGLADKGKEAAKVEGTVAIAISPEVSGDPPQPVKDKLI